MMKMLRISPIDTVAVALTPVEKGEVFLPDTLKVAAVQAIPQGHKMALVPMNVGDPVIKYGNPIGHATQKILPGEWVHTHNVKTNLSEGGTYHFGNAAKSPISGMPETFLGYQRKNGDVGVRNEIWILPTVGCVNSVAQALVNQNQHLVTGTVEGLYTFPHPFGCSQMGEDHMQTKTLLAALCRHPNAGGVLVLSLGCENLTHDQMVEALGEYDTQRIRFLTCQKTEDELAAGSTLLEELAAYAGQSKREPLSVSSLVVGMKCGGSDGLSGITANPVVGAFSDMLIAQGGSTVLTEVPEMFGAEQILMDRCFNEEVFHKAVNMVENFKEYFVSHGQVVYENPSPGNKEGGITTLEDKSLGCVQKGGSAPVMDVIGYAEQVRVKGLNLLSGPGNDLVSATALTAAGAHLILFTTGRGTPFGAPAPTMKIASNTELFTHKNGWMDFNAGTVAEGEPIEEAGKRLLQQVIAAASGEKTKAELHGFREISIWKDGVVL